MSRSVVDTSVLFAAGYRRDARHEDALPIFRGIDDQSLPECVVLEYVLAETLNGLTTHAGHTAAVDVLNRLEGNDRFHIDSPSADGLARAKSLFRRHEGLSFVDAYIAAYMQSNEIEFCYALDDGFDRLDDLSRLETATNPYDPR